MKYSRILICLSVIASSVHSADIYSLIRAGKIDQARAALEKVGDDSLRSGDMLYFRALVEPDGRRSGALLEEAFKGSSDSRYRDDITLRLAQFYAALEEYASVTRLVQSTKTASFAIQRLAALARQESEKSDNLLAKLESAPKLTVEQKQWLGIDRARVSLAAGKRKSAQAALGSLAGSKNKQIVPQALYLLCQSAIEAGQIDEAARWYNLLNEQFPGAVGLDQLVDRLGSIPPRAESDTRAEKATGTFYSIKAGVFSSAENASSQAARLAGTKLKIETVKKTVAGKLYSTVFVGRFSTFDEADRMREELESKFGEQYQVVAR